MCQRVCAAEGCSKQLGPRTKFQYCEKHQYYMRTYGVPYRPTNIEYAHGSKHGNFKHGKPPEYGIWIGMKSRCYYPKDLSYKRYGGRGIKVCDRWLGKDGFNHFLEDMGTRPAGKTKSGRALFSLDRIDNNGNYCPENCRWANTKTQSNNRRTNHKIKGKTLAEWGEELGGCRHLIRRRLKAGWTEEEAISAPKGVSLKTYRKMIQ